MSSISLIDLLSLRKWESALFTTYALSLTFFETCVLRELRQQECRQVCLVTDAVGYLSSLGERRSTRVGHEYQVIPVALPNGVFHPKCTYLGSSKGDVLIIGSGNLTFGGFGRNLEVFEILEPHTAPKAFEDFAEFLDALGERNDMIIPDKAWLQQFATLSRQQAQGRAPLESYNPRVLHSATRPIIDQIAAQVPGLGDKTLTVLSPFHDTEGTAVKKLADRVHCSNIRIALPTRHASETTFPFPAAITWGDTVSAVTPVIDEPKRNLHAKWFEIAYSGGPMITFTGSVNATSQSLCSTNNIEAGVLHIDTPQQNRVVWKQSSIPSNFTKLSYSSSGLGNKCLVYASLHGNGTLSGCIIASGSLKGSWVGFLESSTGDQFDITIIVADGGKFVTSIACSPQFLFAPGLQIVLEKEQQRARGWVIQQDILKLRPEQRTIIRFLNDEDTIDDEVALLDYLAQSINTHLDVFKTLIKHERHADNSGESGKSTSPITIYLAEIAPASAADEQKQAPVDTSHHFSEFDLLSRLRRYLLGERYTSRREMEDVEVEPENDEDQDAQREEQAKRKLIVKRLDSFESTIRKCLDETRDFVKHRAALVYWLEVELHMLKRHNLREEALQFIGDWFWKACAEKLYVEPGEALEQHLFTTAAVKALLLEDNSRQKALVTIHNGLEHFIGGAVDHKMAVAALINHPDVGFASFLVPDKAIFLTSALQDVLNTTTLRSQLEQELKRYEAGEDLDEKAQVFLSDVGKVFHSLLKKKSGIKIYQQAIAGVHSCPFCYMSWTTQAETDLKNYRIARCTSCGKFAINLVP